MLKVNLIWCTLFSRLCKPTVLEGGHSQQVPTCHSRSIMHQQQDTFLLLSLT